MFDFIVWDKLDRKIVLKAKSISTAQEFLRTTRETPIYKYEIVMRYNSPILGKGVLMHIMHGPGCP